MDGDSRSIAVGSQVPVRALRPFEGLWRRRSLPKHTTSSPHPASELVSTLNEVADAVSSAIGFSEVLEVIVDRAKRITQADKAVLVLADEHGGGLDLDSILVRGRRSEHKQHWWQERLDILADQVFETGHAVVEYHAAEHAHLLCSPVLVKDHPIGMLAAINSADRPFAHDQLDVLAILSAFAASAIENARLAEQSRYVLLASERDRIAREMHDGVVQSLFSISLGLEVCKKQVYRDPPLVAERLEELQLHLNHSMTELRRFIYDLRQMKLAELGLVGAVEYWIREVTDGRPVRGYVVVQGTLPRMSPAQEACLYRVAKEAISNVVRHSDAQVFNVRIKVGDGVVRLEVVDDGKGFDTLAMGTARSTRGKDGLGLDSIRNRIAQERGQFSVESVPGQGTRLSVELPAVS